VNPELAAGHCGRAWRGEPPRRCQRFDHTTPQRLPAAPGLPAPNVQTDEQHGSFGAIKVLGLAALGLLVTGRVAYWQNGEWVFFLAIFLFSPG